MSNDTYNDWLKDLAETSRVKQEHFMDGIARRLKRPRLKSAPSHPFRGAPDYWREFQWSSEERLEKFTVNFVDAGGHVIRLKDMEEVKTFITNKASELNAQYILRQNNEELAAMGLEEVLEDKFISTWNEDAEVDWKARAAEADIGVVIADHAVAYTGSITVLSSKDKGRSVSLLPTVLIAIIPVERMVTTLGEVLDHFDEAGRSTLPAGIHFISGPSRSADIENDLTIGVHGPGVVFALLVG
mgnify:CR=1 FL=1